MLPGRRSAFRAEFWPDCYRESTEVSPLAGLRPAGGPISVLSRKSGPEGRFPARRHYCVTWSTFLGGPRGAPRACGTGCPVKILSFGGKVLHIKASAGVWPPIGRGVALQSHLWNVVPRFYARALFSLAVGNLGPGTPDSLRLGLVRISAIHLSLNKSAYTSLAVRFFSDTGERQRLASPHPKHHSRRLSACFSGDSKHLTAIWQDGYIAECLGLE